MKLSKSAVNSFLKCPREFQYKYVDNIETPPNEFMEFGSMIHNYAENVGKFLKKFQDNDVEVVEEDIINAEEYAKSFLEIDVDNIERTQKHIDNLHMFFMTTFIDNDYKIFSIEEYIYDTDCNLSGLADIVLENVNGDLIVVDYKTSKSGSIKKYRLELCYYKKLLEFQYPGRTVVTAGIYFTSDNGYRFLNFTDEQVKGSFISSDDYKASLDILEYIREEVNRGIFLPNRQFLCKYCTYNELCERDGNF